MSACLRVCVVRTWIQRVWASARVCECVKKKEKDTQTDRRMKKRASGWTWALFLHSCARSALWAGACNKCALRMYITTARLPGQMFPRRGRRRSHVQCSWEQKKRVSHFQHSAPTSTREASARGFFPPFFFFFFFHICQYKGKVFTRSHVCVCVRDDMHCKHFLFACVCT